MRLRRDPVSSMNTVRRIAVRPPAVMPLPSSAPHHSPNCSAKITLFWNPTPIQNATPAIVALR